MKLSECIPWDELAESYYQSCSESEGRPTKDARLVIGAVILKHKLCLSERETVMQIQENPYLQYFVGLPGFTKVEPFTPSLVVEIRKRMGASVLDSFETAVIDAVETKKAEKKAESNKNSKSDDDNEPPSAPVDGWQEEQQSHQGKLIWMQRWRHKRSVIRLICVS